MATQPSNALDELGADGRPRINQQHINYVTAVCTNLAQTPVGGLAGRDELLSEAMVVLWDLALAWAPATGVPFSAFLSINIRRRLIDWLRSEYGRRARGVYQPQLVAAFGQVSLDMVTPEGTAYERADPGPSTEEIVTARDDLAGVIRHIRATCTERQRDALLAPVTGTSPAGVAAKWGMSVASMYAHAHVARKRLRESMPGPIIWAA